MKGAALRARCTRYIDQLESFSGMDPVAVSTLRMLVCSAKRSSMTSSQLWHDNVALRVEVARLTEAQGFGGEPGPSQREALR